MSTTARDRARRAGRRLVPSFARPTAALAITKLGVGLTKAENWRAERRLSRVRPGDAFRYHGYEISVNDRENVRVLCRDIFGNHIYGFDARRSAPRILDCGSNIGMSILYFKRFYPAARVIGLEPDPLVFPYLERNIVTNGLRDVELLQAAVGTGRGTVTFYSDGKYGSRLADDSPPPEGWQTCEVPCVSLADLLSEPVDFMKMNVEGAEADSIESAGDALRAIREMIIEYHHLPGLPRTLHLLLATLHAHGFETVVHDYYGPRRGPFQLGPQTRAFPLVHALRID